jgi:hypothetical protein
LFEKPRWQFEGLFPVTQTKVNADAIFDRTRLDGGTCAFAAEGT